jgi:hypothetical protein
MASIIVKAYGRQLDELRSAAYRLAGGNFDWLLEAPDEAARFSFDDAKSKDAFVSYCKELGLPWRDGDAPRR